MRPLTDNMLAALAAPIIRPALLYDGTFASGSVHIWTGIGPLVWRGTEYSGLGQLIGVSLIEETDDVKATGIQCNLSGVDSAQISFALLEMQRNSPGVIWLALLEEDGATIIPDPYILFRGRLDVATIQDARDGAMITLNYENELIDLERPREVRYTPQEQYAISPGDTFLDFVPGLQDKELHWGNTS